MFSNIYADQMSDVDYTLIFEFLTKYINKSDSILDAGCGPGYLMKEFISNNYDIIGIDNDEGMLSQAVNYQGLQGKVFKHDLNEPIMVDFNIVISIFDVVNYFEDVSKYFYNVYNALLKGGKFIFDVYSIEAIEKMKNYYEETDGLKWKIEIVNNQINHTITTNHNEIHKITQYFYKIEYYIDILNDLGFKSKITNGPDSRKKYIIAEK